MKSFILAAPVALLLGSVAFAQTSTDGTSTGSGSDTTTGAATGTSASGGTYGTDWSQSIGSTFFSDAENTTLRSTEEVTTGWQSLSREDRDRVLAECERYTNETASEGDAGGGVAASDSSSTGAVSADAGTDTNSTDPMTESSGDAGAGVTATDSTGTDGSIASTVGYSASAMGSLCPVVQGL